MMAQRGPGQPPDLYDYEGSGSRNMLGEREAALVVGGCAGMVGATGAGGTASRAWENVETAIDELLEAKAREEACLAAATCARERVQQVRGEEEAKVERARARGSASAQSVMKDASERLRAVVLRMQRADDDFDIAGATTDDAEDLVDAIESAAEDANARVERAQAKLRATKQSAEWLRAVAVVAR
eukprot:SAG11_NODE_15358_length_581_cov_0.506224_1_plen_185_part_01